jgi:hypothetical protein
MRNGSHHSPETKAKMIASRTGSHRSPETKKRMSEAGKAKWKDPEYIKKHSIAVVGEKNPMFGRSGEKSPVYGRPLSEEAKSKLSQARVGRFGGKNNPRYGKRISAETRAKLSAVCGERASGWKGGISFEPYCPKFNANLKRRVREYFDNQCITCGKLKAQNITLSGRVYELGVHHVEYNKSACCDGKPVQFAALCFTCHMITNGDRERWEAILHRIIDEIYSGRSYFTKDEWVNRKIDNERGYD